MLRLISDHNFSGRILRGVGRRIPNLDLVRAFDAGLATAPDPVLLEWAAAEGRILCEDAASEPASRSLGFIREGFVPVSVD
jgi:hypothetical protein